MSWAAIVVLAFGTYALKAAGPMLLGGLTLPRWLGELTALLPASLLCAIVVVGTLADGRSLTVPRAAGLAAAGVAVWRRAPFVATVFVGTAATALFRWLAA